MSEDGVIEMPKRWLHKGGGCGFCGLLPCDDDYEEDSTGNRVRFLSTQESHFLMPTEIRDMPRFLRSIAGRWDVKVST